MTIDHAKRRRHIAEITIELIAREGLGAATIRRIASEAGFSTAAITHYFADKQELILWAFEVLSSEGEERFAEVIRSDPWDVLGALLTMVAWCPANVRRWKAYLAFWDQAARDPHLVSLLARSTESGISMIASLLTTTGAAAADVAKASRLLNSIVQGLSMQAIVAPENWPPDLIRQTLVEGIEMTYANALRGHRENSNEKQV